MGKPVRFDPIYSCTVIELFYYKMGLALTGLPIYGEQMSTLRLPI